jgi:hypothetical protein
MASSLNNEHSVLDVHEDFFFLMPPLFALSCLGSRLAGMFVVGPFPPSTVCDSPDAEGLEEPR